MEFSSIAEQLFFTAIRIQTRNSKGEIGIGTGFIFDYELNSKKYLFLVTNKHVVSGTTEGLLTLIKSDGKNPILGDGYTIKITDFESKWFGHKKEKIDVTIMPFVPFLNHISNQGVKVFFRSISREFIPSNDVMRKVDAIEEVLFIGYPSGIWDTKNLTPIIRQGITATPVDIDFGGEKQFLIDASVFPGSSGSPVFLYNAGHYTVKGKGVVIGSRLIFLGILASVFYRQDTNEIEIVDIPTTKRPVTLTKQMIDLGIVFKTQTIVETIEDFLKTHK